MDNTIEKYKRRRQARIEDRLGKNVDGVEEYRSRRVKRLEKRLDAGVGWVFGVLKENGIDTKGMSVDEAFEALGKLNGGGEKNREETKKTAKEGPSDFQEVPKSPKVKGMTKAQVSKVIETCHHIGGSNYDDAIGVAKEKPYLRTFTTHGLDHVEQVLEKTSQAADVVEALNGSGFKGTKMDRKLMLVSAYMHDTGMDGGDIDWSGDDGNGIRSNHAMNSAIHVLRYGDELEGMGVNPSQVAFNVFAHTKSNSGIRDLTDPAEMENGLNKVEKAVEEYNERNPDKKIKFDRDAVFGGEPNEENIRHMACQIAALRLGDANREANIPLRSQTGGEYKIDKLPDPEKCMSIDDEERLAKISINNETGKHDLDDDNDKELGELARWSRNISKHTVLGERNMVKVDAVAGNRGVEEAVVLKNGNAVPWSTTEALLERCGELNTINGIPRGIRVKMGGLKSVDDMTENAEQAYRKMWNRILTEQKKGLPAYDGIDRMVLEFEDGEPLVYTRTNENNNNRRNR